MGLLERNIAAPMQQKEADRVGGKPHQAALAGFDGSATRRMMGENLAGRAAGNVFVACRLGD